MDHAQRQLVFLLHLKTFKNYIKKHKKGIKKVESLVETSRGKESVLAQLRVQDLYRKNLFSTLEE